MRHKNSSLNGIVSAILLLIGLAGLAGCAGRADKMHEQLVKMPDVELHGIIRQGLAASGGLDSWAQTTQIDGDAIVTIFDNDRSKTFIEQQQKIVTTKNRLEIWLTSTSPQGTELERLSADGKISMMLLGGQKPVKIDDPAVLGGSLVKLKIISQAITGAAGLLQEGYRLQYAGLERQGGRPMHKIAVSGSLVRDQKAKKDKEHPDDDNDELLVIWLDSQTQLVDRLWLKYRKLGEPRQYGYIAAAVSEYAQVGSDELDDNELVLPHRIEFLRCDQHQQFSQEAIMAVEYQRLMLTQRPADKKRLWGLF